MRVDLPLIGPSYANRSLPLSAQVTKGFYPEVNQESRNLVALNPFPGLREFSVLSGEGRGLHVMNGVLFAVSGGNFSRVNADGASTTIGNIAGSGLCDFDDNGRQLAITTGSTPYVYDGTLSPIDDPDLVNPTTVAYLNSKFVYDRNSGQDGEFVVGDVGDATSVEALSFAQAESHPDDIKRNFAANQLMHFFGSQSIEPWFDSGVGVPPLERVQGGVKEFGVAGPWAVAASEGQFYFLDNKRMPRRMSGLDVVSIGNPAIGKEWDSYDRVDDAIAMIYTLDQQNFFQISFPSADRTWVYHETASWWFQLSDGPGQSRHRGMSYAKAYGKHIIQDHSNGKLYELDFDTFTDDGKEMQRRRSTAVIHGGLYGAPGKVLEFDMVEFVLQTGEGTPTGQGQTPVVAIRHSDDGGRTWSTESHHDLGVGGNYLATVVLCAEGTALQRIYELTITDPVPVTLISAHADISVGL